VPTRRQFLSSAGVASAAVVLAPQELVLAQTRRPRLLRGGRFADGVISADPTPSSVALWTRVDDAEGSGRILLEVARDPGFRRVVARKQIPTSGAVNHAVKAQVSGLKAHEQYFYRFATATRDSPVGRFRTAAPAGSSEPVRFAYFSCQDYTHGFYNAHELLAGEDLDFVVCLGDYIYAETYHSKAGTKTAVRDDRIGRTSRSESHLREAITLDDYRAKYSLYRSDPALRAVHQRFPMVYVPDDHEVVDNYAGAEPDAGLAPEKQYSAQRKKVARKAFFESNPRFPANRLYRSLTFGRTVELFVMDQRTYREDQPCGDAVAPPCEDWTQPRTLLGTQQLAWLKSGLSRSKASWKIMANEVTIMPTVVLGGSYFTYDPWQGYPTERESLLKHIDDENIRDVVFVTGDIHTFIAGDVRREMGNGKTVALEFVGGSITSQGLGETDIDAGGGVIIKGNDQNPNTSPELISALRDINPWVDQADFDHHGYGVIEASGQGLKSRFVRLKTIKRRSRAKLPSTGFVYDVDRGQTSIKGVNGPPPP
jgi:alkaline phosphatase D